MPTTSIPTRWTRRGAGSARRFAPCRRALSLPVLRGGAEGDGRPDPRRGRGGTGGAPADEQLLSRLLGAQRGAVAGRARGVRRVSLGNLGPMTIQTDRTTENDL